LKNFITVAKLLSLLNVFKLLHIGCSNTCRAAEVNAITNYSFILMWKKSDKLIGYHMLFRYATNVLAFCIQEKHKKPILQCVSFWNFLFPILLFSPLQPFLAIYFLFLLKFIKSWSTICFSIPVSCLLLFFTSYLFASYPVFYFTSEIKVNELRNKKYVAKNTIVDKTIAKEKKSKR